MRFLSQDSETFSLEIGIRSDDCIRCIN